MIPPIIRHPSSITFKARSFLFILLLIVLLPASGLSQQSAARPKVGLALSGGGSLGMAHVGVLKVMEEAGLYPDFITGVSMGSIIGGLYSLGYSADSLQTILRNADWNLILSNKIPDNKVIFTEKKNYSNSIMSLPVTSRKLRLPTGLINGQQIENMLSYYVWPAADINDFSKLPVPFMCLGTDLITVRKVELKSGYLPDAIRASIAVPSILTPLKIDSAILIDGGFVRNIAVTELRKMGAEIIIGSYTGFIRYTEKELQSMPGVLKQLSLSNSFDDFQEEKKMIDFLIQPKVKDLSSAVFSNVDTIVQRGYTAALPFREKFRELADSLDRIGSRRSPEYILGKQTYSFDRIVVEGNDIISDDQVLGVLDIEPGALIDKENLREKIELLYGRAWFDKVKYRIVPRNDSLMLVIACEEKPQAMLYGSVHYDNSIRAGMLLSFSVKNLLTSGTIVDLDSYIGQFYRFRFLFTKFLDRNQRLGLTTGINASNTLIPHLILNGEAGQMLRRGFSAGLNLNERIGLNDLMSISLDFKNVGFLPDFLSESHLKKISFNCISASFRNQYNSLDNKHFPERGTLLGFSLGISRLVSEIIRAGDTKQIYNLDSTGSLAFKRTFTAEGSMTRYISLARRISMSARARGLFTYTADSIITPDNYYYLGGQAGVLEKSITMIGFHPGELAISKFAGFGLDADFEFIENLHLTFMTDIGYAREVNPGNGWSLLGGFGIGIGYMSVIGPLKAGLMYGSGNAERYFQPVKGYISIGFSF